MARRTWTPEQRRHALVVYVDHGPAEAARRTGIPSATIASWAHRNGVQTRCIATTRAATEHSRLRWEERRAEMVHEIGAVAALALERAHAELDAGHARNAKDLATTMAILVDKAQLLAGDATSRSEVRTVDQIDAQVEQLVARLEAAA